jgi:predicted esterase
MPASAIVLVASLAACSASGGTPIASTAGPSHTAATPVPTPPATLWPSVVALPTALPATMNYDQALPLFAYNGAKLLDLNVLSSENNSGATVEEITFSGAAGETVQAYLILPAGNGPFPAVLFEHGAGGSSETFLAEATSLAQERRIAGLVVSRPTGLDNAGDDTIETILQVREMRRALDLLASQPQVDKSRLGYLGHSQGSIYGLTLLSVEPRIKTAALMAVVPGSPALDIAAAHVIAPTVLLQFGSQDGYYTKTTAEALAGLIAATHKVSWYDAGHSLNSEAMTERAAWLTAQLGAK